MINTITNNIISQDLLFEHLYPKRKQWYAPLRITTTLQNLRP